MLVTIFSDASFCKNTQAGGWGGWAKSQRGTMRHSGAIRHQVFDASQAEMCAILNTIHLAVKRGVAITGDTLLIESDSLDALGCFERRCPGKKKIPKGKRGARDRARRERRRFLIDAFTKMVEGFQLRFKWVKGHQNDNAGPRAFINNQCDRDAKRHMRVEQATRRMPRHEVVQTETPQQENTHGA